jgi:DNA primase
MCNGCRDRYNPLDYDIVVVASYYMQKEPVRWGSMRWCHCIFHRPDEHESMALYEEDGSVYCYTCGRRGTAVDFVMQKLGLSFLEAKERLRADGIGREGTTRTTAQTAPRKATGRPERRRATTDEEAALHAVQEAIRLLHRPTHEAGEARRHLRDDRGLIDATVDAARLGFSSKRVRWLPGWPAGLFVPWFEADRLVKLTVRQPDELKVKYRVLYANNHVCYPSPAAIRPGMPLVICEGEFDALLVGQELDGLASVITTGSASSRPLPAVMEAARSASRIYAAHDADGSGDDAAARWQGVIRVRPPQGKDWCEARLAGVDLKGFWAELLRSDM